ncbi:hypothetical protein [Fictibacillus norfolkensis]|uniref:Butirosin biosynthesis protein H N-terminal domain-containing protein n=1 Tax=Fictibacillus norfolkensis TaxID=2762233 RepID=A0ABR8SH06_9BACL|nr:hypothetical protein [Fictibacillus norfolkensis]MBD7962766.1 hypothetical protein [Fictibacillus norfolkensis]
MSKELINFNKNFNCYFLTVRAILSRKAEITDLFWNQAAMISTSEEDVFSFTPYHKSLPEQLYEYFNIEEKIISTQDFEEFYREVKETTALGYTILLISDCYDLPHTLYYQQRFNHHAVEIFSADEDEVHIVDHYYNYSGSVPKESLRQILLSRIDRGEAPGFELIYYKTEEMSVPEVSGFVHTMIDINQTFMRGGDPYQKPNPHPSRKLGIEAFDEFVHHLEHEVFINREDNVDISYHCLKELANSRSNYSHFLLMNRSLSPEMEFMGEGYLVLSNLLQVTANMVLKCFITKRYDQFHPRVMKKLNEIRSKELELLNIRLTETIPSC